MKNLLLVSTLVFSFLFAAAGTVGASSEVPAGKTNIHTFTAVKGEKITVGAKGASTDELTFGVYDESDSLVAKENFVCGSTDLFGFDYECVVAVRFTVSASGKYKVKIGNPTNESQTYELVVGNYK